MAYLTQKNQIICRQCYSLSDYALNTALDMTPLGWLGRKTATQNNALHSPSDPETLQNDMQNLEQWESNWSTKFNPENVEWFVYSEKNPTYPSSSHV